MLAEIGCLMLGLPAGHALRKKERIVLIADKALTWLVWVLLFLLGLTIGYDDGLLSRIDVLGWRAMLICICSVAGSLAAAWVIGRMLRVPSASRKRADSGGKSNTRAAVCSSLTVLAIFIAGVLCGIFSWLPASLTEGEAVLYTLYVQLFVAGMCIGFGLDAFKILAELRIKALAIPVFVMSGSLIGGVIAQSMLSGISLRDVLAVSGGVSFYSLSSVLLTRLADAELGSLTLLANMAREIGTLVLAPLFQRIIGPFGPLSAAGAAAMDSCLPVIARESGERHAILGVFSGACLTVVVPFWLTFLFSF